MLPLGVRRKRLISGLRFPCDWVGNRYGTTVRGHPQTNYSKCAILCSFELELELIQTQMTQKPMLRAEVYARALRASQNRKEDSV